MKVVGTFEYRHTEPPRTIVMLCDECADEGLALQLITPEHSRKTTGQCEHCGEPLHI